MHRNHHSLPTKPSCAGFTLIEVLIAVLVLSVGLLGLAGLQTTSLRNNNSAYMRSQAAVLAYDIVDRMRANREAALSGDYNQSLTSSYSGSGSIASDDLNAWFDTLVDILPAGQGAVSVSADEVATVTVQWDDSRGQESALAFAVETRL